MIEYYKEILFYIKKNTSNKDIAEDIVQEAYTKFMDIPNQKKIINKRAFLYRVAKNILIDKLRKSKNIQVVPYESNEDIEKTQEPETILLEQERQVLLMKELKKLPAKRKEAFVLHVLEGYSRKEVAEMMNISVSAVEKHISRASIELKEKLGKEG